jgi:hypothetical protein
MDYCHTFPQSLVIVLLLWVLQEHIKNANQNILKAQKWKGLPGKEIYYGMGRGPLCWVSCPWGAYLGKDM